MISENQKLAEAIERDLLHVYVELRDLKGGETVVRTGDGFGELENDTEILADRFIGELLVKKFSKRSSHDAGRITIEGFETDISGSGQLWYCVDPLDGSLNFKTRGTGIGLPYCSCVTVLKGVNHDHTFSDVLVGSVFDLRSHDRWTVFRNEAGEYRSRFNRAPARTLQETHFDLGSMIVLGEMYYPENREMLCRAFAGEKGSLRNCGSAAYEMALVASGTAAAFICDRQKNHELGAGYALVLGAGGVAVDLEGNDIGQLPYDFNAKTPVILAANQEIADQILERIQYTP